MKERFNLTPIESELTNEAQNQYSGAMAEPGQGETQPQGGTATQEAPPQASAPVPPSPRRPQVSEEAKRMARQTWEDYFQRKGEELEALPLEQRVNVEGAIDEGMGIPPLGQLTDERVEDLAQRWIDDVLQGRWRDPEYVKLRKVDIQRVMDTDRAVPRDQALRILRNMDQWETQAQRERVEKQIRYGVYGQRELTEDEKEIIRIEREEQIEPIFNRMFAAADARPKEQFREAFGTTGGLEFQEFVQTLTLARDDPRYAAYREEINKKINKYTSEKEAREILHNANYAVLAGITTDKLSEFVGGFRSELADLMFSKKGVVSAMHFYEQALLRIREENNGFIPYIEVVGDPETGKPSRAEALTRELLSKHMEIEKWEEDRAIAIARGMSIVLGRAIEIAATSKIPPNNPILSLYAQDIIKELAPFRHTVGKFHLGEEAGLVLGYLLNVKKKTWTYGELEELAREGHKKIVETVNGLTGSGGFGLVDEKEERYLSVLNPFKVGGLFTRTTWRLSTRSADEKNPVPSLVGDFDEEQQKWMGTGIIIEKNRGTLTNPEKSPEEKEKAREKIRFALEKTARILPTRLLYNIEELQKSVLKEMGVSSIEGLEDELNELTLLQEKAVTTKTDSLDFNLIKDSDQRIRIERLVGLIREKFVAGGERSPMNNFINNLEHKDWRIPYNFGLEDVPYAEYQFGKIGGTGIARIWRDNASAKKAAEGLFHLIEGMPLFKDQPSIVKVIAEIHNGIAGYDKTVARNITTKFAEGVIKFYGKDWFSRLPLGLGTVISTVTGRASFAQAAFGRGAMAWDEVEVNEFTRLLRDSHLISHEEQLKLQERAGGGKKELAYGITRTLVPLLTAALIYYILSRALKEK